MRELSVTVESGEVKVGDFIIRQEGSINREYYVLKIENGITAVLFPLITDAEHIRRCNERVIADAKIQYLESCKNAKKNSSPSRYR